MKPRTPVVRPIGRTTIAAMGLVFVLVGIARLRMGVQVISNSRGLPIWSSGIIGVGIVVILLALVPSSWIASSAAIKPPRSKTRR